MAVDVRALWDFDDPVASESRLRRAAEGAGPVDRFVLLTQVARALGLQERYDEAHALLDTLERPPLTGSDDAALAAHADLERGRLFRSAGRLEEALECFERAVSTADEGDDDAVRVDALHMLALAQPVPEQAARLNRQALRLARGSDDPAARRWEASLLNNLGCALVDEGELDTALATFEEAVELRRRQGDRRETQIARWMVGWTLRLLDRPDEALQVQRALKEELEQDGVEDPYVDEELALLTT